MSIVAHSSFRLSNSNSNNNGEEEVVLVVSDNMDDLFAMENAQQKTSSSGLVDQAVRAPPATSAAPLIVTEELLRLVIDPISLDIMMDPVLAGDHYTYDRQSITKWLAMKGATPNPHGYVRLPKVPSPCTGQDLVHHNLTPNVVVKNLIELVVSSLQQQLKDGGSGGGSGPGALPAYHDEMLRDYLHRQDQVKRAQRKAENLKKLYGAHCCPQNHPMTLIRCGALPRDYEMTTTTMARGVDSVTCSCCDHGHIAEINWYFHCNTCQYDMCANCIANRHHMVVRSHRRRWPRQRDTGVPRGPVSSAMVAVVTIRLRPLQRRLLLLRQRQRQRRCQRLW